MKIIIQSRRCNSYNLVWRIIAFICTTISCCSNPTNNQKLNNSTFHANDSIHGEAINVDSFVNRINYSSITFPFVATFRDSGVLDTLKYEVAGDQNTLEFHLYLSSDMQHRIVLKDADGFYAYDEGDLDGDGAAEIGIILAFPNGACRQYNIFSYKKNGWKRLYSISTHLPDRMQGVDYIKRAGNQVRIIEAIPENCCQCLGLDTTYRSI